MNRAEEMCKELDELRYASSGERYLSAKISVDTRVERRYVAQDMPEVQKAVCGDGFYSDNNGIAHMSRYLSVLDQSVPLIVGHMIEPRSVDMRDDEDHKPKLMQIQMIEGYCAKYRNPTDEILNPVLFEDYRIVEMHTHRLFGRINLNITVVDMTPLTVTSPVRIVFVGFVRESKTLPMLPYHKDRCKKHRDFASESYDALTSQEIARCLNKYCAIGCCVALAGGGMKTCTAGITLMQYIYELRVPILGIAGVSGGSWAMMYHVSNIDRDKHGLERIHGLLNHIEERWTQVTQKDEIAADDKSIAKNARLQEVLASIQTETSFLTLDQLDYVNSIIRVVGDAFDCDWHQFIHEWLFEGWTMNDEYANTPLMFGCTIFEQAHMIGTVPREGFKKYVVGAVKMTTEGVGMGIRNYPKASALVGLLPLACNYFFTKNRAIQYMALPCHPISFVFKNGLCTVYDNRMQGIDVANHPDVMVGEEISMPTASAISSAAAAGLTSTTLMETLLYKYVSLSPYKTAQGIQIAALPRRYPNLAIPVSVSLFRCPGAGDAGASSSTDGQEAPPPNKSASRVGPDHEERSSKRRGYPASAPDHTQVDGPSYDESKPRQSKKLRKRHFFDYH
jgi:hypothetical protein